MRWSVVALLLATAGLASATSTLDRVNVLHAAVLAVHLDVSPPVDPEVHTLPAGDGLPPRIYVDLPGVVLSDVVAPSTAGVAGLLRIRTGQFTPSTSRVVLDLAAPTAFVVRRTDTGITIELPGVHDATPPTIEAAPRPATPPAAVATPRTAPESPRVAARAPVVAERRPLVVIDAGHGGRDPGATGLDGVFEKTVTLELAHRVALRLPDRLPVEVQLTRRDDAFLPINARIALASEAALFISLHANASLDPRMCGIEVFFGGGATAAASGPDRPVRLGLAVVEALEQRLGDVHTLVRPGDYGVLARNAVPSVLIEVGYLTNVDDAAHLRDGAYRDRIADAVIDAVDAFLHDRIAS
jgi:N-acetylmuramoyl-L-alanine amidase